MDECIGYACPPVNSHMFTPEPYVTLATTGGYDPTAGIIVAALLLIAGGALFAYNHMKRGE